MKPTTLQTILYTAIAIAFGCASPAQAALLLYEGFQTGAGGYTADAALYGAAPPTQGEMERLFASLKTALEDVGEDVVTDLAGSAGGADDGHGLRRKNGIEVAHGIPSFFDEETCFC